MITQKKKYDEIVILRVLSMTMIVLCHIIKFYQFLSGHNIIGQMFNVGVYVFLLVSGYLYGKKDHVHFREFITKRIQKIYIPVLIVVLCVLCVNIIVFSESYSVATIGLYLFNLQGLLLICWDLLTKIVVQIENLGPLWFTTIIMLCYCMIPMFCRMRRQCSQKVQYLLWALFYIAALLLLYFFEINLVYFPVFYLGFLMASTNESEKQKMGIGKVVLYTVLLGLQATRLYLQIKNDGTRLYTVFVSLSHPALAVLIFMCVFEISKKLTRMVEKIANSRIIKTFDKTSFHVYLVHGIFCMGALNVYTAVSNLWIATGLFLLAVTLSTIILYYAEQGVLKLMNRK